MAQNTPQPPEVIESITKKLEKNPLMEIAKAKLREAEQKEEESKRKKLKRQHLASLQDVEKALGLNPPLKGTWNRERSLSCLQAMGKPKPSPKLPAKEVESLVVQAYQEFLQSHPDLGYTVEEPED